jgi:chaperonin GroES
MNKLAPLNDQVVIRRIEKIKTTLSGIVIPDNAGDAPDQGEVLAVGPGLKRESGERDAMGVQVGDIVVFAPHTGQTIKVDGEELLIIKEAELQAVVEK